MKRIILAVLLAAVAATSFAATFPTISTAIPQGKRTSTSRKKATKQ